MCGICGIFRPDGAPVDPGRVLRMREEMVARGPDASGLVHGRGFALGHRRLAILDLSDAGRQPMANEDDQVRLVFNGEIYNFRDLRSQLEAAGHRFSSDTDSEVLIHGYESWGLGGLLERIRGMYAFALIDAREGEIHLARDPLGKKPLFFRWQGGELAFASSARALATGLETTPEINPAAIDDLLWNLYIPGPRTIFRGVEKLMPGHAVSFGQDGRRDLTHWQPDFCHPDPENDGEEWLERIEAALTRAVRRRLVADVPVGIMLSGGVDSSLVTAIAAKIQGSVKTFSVQTEDPAMDESQYARSVADHCGTEHHLLPVRGDVRRNLTQLVASMGEPMADSSAANLLAIAQVARQSVTVVLTGDGGDECFGGYGHFWAYHVSGRLRQFLPQFTLPPVAAIGNQLLHAHGPAHRLGSLLHRAAAPLEQSFCKTGWIDENIRSSLLAPEFRAQLLERQPTEHYVRALRAADGALPVDRVMRLYMETILPDDFLAKVDLATMATSLEARCPFLDLEVVELAARIPASVRFLDGQRKGLLRRLARRLLPPATVDRRKQGFGAPIGHWLRSQWSDLVDSFILGPHVEQRGWFRREALERMVAEHRAGANHGDLLWTLLILELWLRMTVDRTLPTAAVL